MNFLDALKKITENNTLWARPISWKGCYQAICFDKRDKYSSGGFFEVPTSGDPRRANIPPSPSELFGEWEAIDPGDVIAGK